MINGGEDSWSKQDRVSNLAQCRRQESKGAERRERGGSIWLAAVAPNSVLCSLAADLAEYKLVSFPMGVYKVLRNVTTRFTSSLANQELKSLTSKFTTMFCQPWLAQASGVAWLAPIRG